MVNGLWATRVSGAGKMMIILNNILYFDKMADYWCFSGVLWECRFFVLIWDYFREIKV